MKKIYVVNLVIISLLFLSSNIACRSQSDNDTIFIATWNVENLFDTEDDPLKNDNEFLPLGKKEWTEDKLETKLNCLARVINYMNNGRGPDILAIQEVENINVTKRLLYKLDRGDYVAAYRESPDERGIDVTLIYDRKKFNIISVDTLRVNLPNKRNTRYILQAILNFKSNNDTINIFVNHWPSRSGGNAKTEPFRIIAAKILRDRVESVFKTNPKANIIILGDFNDEPEDVSIKDILKTKNLDCNKKEFSSYDLYNLSIKKYKSGEGTFFYKGNWKMLDQIIISSSLIDKNKLDYICDSFEIVKPFFMITKENQKYFKPFPTYKGNKYLGGFSDHFPIAAKFIYLKERK